MNNSNIYVPPHRRNSQNNVYVPPHRRDSHQSDSHQTNVNTSNDKSSRITHNTHKNNDIRLNKKVVPDNSHSSSESVSSITDILSSLSIDHKLSSPPIDCEKYSHILEISGFASTDNSSIIEKLFSDYSNSGGFCLKWVDDLHCLIVFSSSTVAQSALSDDNITSRLTVTTIESASRASKWKIVKSPGDWALPYKSRPPVLLNASRRMIYHSLGLRPQITEDQKRIEELKIREFKNSLRRDS